MLCGLVETVSKESTGQGYIQALRNLSCFQMNLASPPSAVEAAVATRAENVESATAAMAPQSEPVDVGAPAAVDPAVPFDDPMRYAPNIVANPKKFEPDALSVQVLRENDATIFESYAAIQRGALEKNVFKRCIPCFDERDFATYGEMKKYCLVNGDCCFVYGFETDNKPLYVVSLTDYQAIFEDPANPDVGSITVSPMPGTNKPHKNMSTILLKLKSDGSHAFQFTFDIGQDETLAKRFCAIVQNADSKAEMKRAP